jgi:hypothetical protein
VRFYQRLLARDEDEATKLAESKRQELGDVGVIESVLMPALLLASEHRASSEITEEDALFVLDVMNEVVQRMAPVDESLPVAPVIGLAARTPEDQTALQLLRAAVGSRAMTLIPLDLSADEALAEAIEQRPMAVCIGAISPARNAEVRNYCRRLRSAVPETKIIMLRPAVEADIERSQVRMHEAGADIIVGSAKDAIEAIQRLLAAAPAPLRAVGQE